MGRLFGSVLLGALLACSGTAAATELDPDSEGAHRHFVAGSKLYERTDYLGAVREFEAARRLKPLPAFDYNIARAYDRLQRWSDAIVAYERYLATKPADAAEIAERIKVLRARLGEDAAQPNAPVSDQTRARAKEHADGAMRFSGAGQHARAAEEYLKAYVLVHDVAVLFAVAEAYRLDRDWAHALKYYRQFVAESNDARGKETAATHIAQIEATIAKQGKAPPATTPPPPDADVNRRAAIEAVIKQNRLGFRACFDEWSKDHIGIDARFVLVVSIDTDGKVESSSAAAMGVEAPQAEKCIATYAASLAMPASKAGYSTRLTYPFSFKAR